jgi:TP901 family phage tail tape measure protein
MVDAGKVRIVLEMDDADFRRVMGNTQGELGKLNSTRLDNLGNSLTGIGKTLTAGVTLPLVGMGVVATQQFLAFDESMSRTQAITGMTSEEIAGLGETAKTMAGDSIFSAQEVAEGMYWIADSTTSAADIQNYLAASMNLATASGSDLGETAQTLQGIMNAYGIDSSEAGRVTDILTVAFQNSLWTGQEFNTAMSYVASTASSLGIPLEQTAAALDVMSRAGYDASTSGAALRMGMVRLVNPTSDALKALSSYGLTADDVNPQVVGLDKALQNLKNANLDAGDAARIFGVEAMGPMMSVIGEADGEFANLTGAMRDSAGAAEEAAGIVENSTSGQWKQLVNELKTLAIDIGTVLVPILKDIFSAVKPVLEIFKNLPEPVQKAVVVMGMVAAAAGPMLMVFGQSAQGISSLMKAFQKFKDLGGIMGILGKFGGAFKTMMGAIRTGLNFLVGHPIILAIVVIIALIWLLYDNWDLVWSYLEPIWNAIKAVGEAIFNGLVSFFTGLWDGIVAAWNFVWGLIRGILETIWNIIVAVGQFIWDSTVGRWIMLWDLLKAGWEFIWNAIGGILTGIWEFIVGIGEWVWNMFVTNLQMLWNTIMTVWNFIWTTIYNIGMTIWNAIYTVVMTIWNAIKTVIDTVLNSIYTVVMFIWNSIQQGIQMFMNIIHTIISTVWNAIMTVINTVVGTIRAIIDTGFNTIKGIIDFVLGGIRSVFETVWNTIMGIVKGAVDFIMGLLKPLLDIINGVGQSVNNLMSGKGDVIPGLHLFAEGGVVKANHPTLGLFGEGPQDEYFVPEDDMNNILESRQVVALAGTAQSGGTSIGNITINGSNALDIWNEFEHRLRTKGVRF